MNHSAYLTIDDSPCAITNDLIDFLHENEIPALIFVRGDYLEANPAPIINAIQKGFLIGNHLYSHQRASRLELDTIKHEITRTESLIEDAYKSAKASRPLKTLRFPYLDRGMGAWFIEPDSIAKNDDKALYEDLITYGLGNDKNAIPTDAQIAVKNNIQDFLETEGFKAPEFEACTAPWYRGNQDIQRARDTLLTCSSSDWMLTQRHSGKWPWNNVTDLTNRMLENHFTQENGAQIILLHDQNELKDIFMSFIKQLKSAGVDFLPIA